jgi:hypothetical protein
VKNTITYVGIDAHKKDLFIAMLVGDQATPVAWTVPNDPNAIRRLVRKLEREAPGPIRVLWSRTLWGNALVRRLLVETAWHYQHRPSIGVGLTRRRKGQPGRVIAIADKAQQRLCRRFRRLMEQHKPAPKVVVAIARELAGFLWAALQPAPTVAAH